MSGARQIAVYDGQRMIGTVIERGDRTCVAKDADGRRLGTFAKLNSAADAISEADKVFGQARKTA